MSCLICGRLLEEDTVVVVGSKGLKTLCKFSALRKDNLFCENVETEVILHTNCRKKYTKQNVKGVYKPLQSSSQDNVAPEPTGCSSSSSDFPFKEKCFLCAEDLSDDIIDKENRKPLDKRIVILPITKDSTKETILKALRETSSSTNDVVSYYS